MVLFEFRSLWLNVKQILQKNIAVVFFVSQSLLRYWTQKTVISVCAR